MGAKTFNNQTPYQLNITLDVRQGDTPGSSAGTQQFSLNPGQSQLYTYSTDSNPYLDSIDIVIDASGSLIANEQGVTVRSSPVDNAINMNNTVTFSLVNQSLVVGYSNN